MARSKLRAIPLQLPETSRSRPALAKTVGLRSGIGGAASAGLLDFSQTLDAKPAATAPSPNIRSEKRVREIEPSLKRCAV